MEAAAQKYPALQEPLHEEEPAPAPLYKPAPHVFCVGLLEPAGHQYPAEQSPLQPELVRPYDPP